MTDTLIHPREIFELAREAVNEQGAAQNPKELAALGAYLREHALLRPDGRAPNPLRTIVEIGSYKGGTLWFWRRLAPQARIVAVDWKIECEGCSSRRAHVNCPRERIRQNADVFLEQDSREEATARIVARNVGLTLEQAYGGAMFPEGAGIDLLFIDGDHSAAGVEADFQNYCPLLSAAGVAVFHDVGGPVAPHPNREAPTLAVQHFWHNIRRMVPQAFDIIENPGQGYGFGVLPKAE